MQEPFSIAELEAFLDEALPAERMAAIESAARERPEVVEQLSRINARRDLGDHSLGSIWREERITCADRDQWGSYLLGALDPEEAAYLRFHLETIGCRWCRANLEDLRALQSESSEQSATRRRRYFQSSAGYLGRSGGAEAD